MFVLASVATALSCTIYSVHDGDTVSADCGGMRIKVRMVGIDAPELKQKYGRTSRQALADHVFQKKVTLQTQGRDKYGRALGEVFLNGESVNAWMVKGGHAWVYAAKPRREWFPLQESAKAAETGLWRDPRPVAPWIFRR
ncbi:MAG: thermonuclease family protein [bacterium]|jgi:micrococcal nuclease|nr:thermonuclease family protein [Betaproteobacteria bacterium]